jgi:hypothetical protein
LCFSGQVYQQHIVLQGYFAVVLAVSVWDIEMPQKRSGGNYPHALGSVQTSAAGGVFIYPFNAYLFFFNVVAEYNAAFLALTHTEITESMDIQKNLAGFADSRGGLAYSSSTAGKKCHTHRTFS